MVCTGPIEVSAINKIERDSAKISVIVPTIGRPQSLERLLNSLAAQTFRVHEVIIADGSGAEDAGRVAADRRWKQAGLDIKCISVQPPHAVRQREAAIAVSLGELLLLLDDDVELEPQCVAEMVKTLDSRAGVVAVMANFNNQAWAMPPRAWRLYLRIVHGLREGEWQGRVIGPLLRFGFNPPPSGPVSCEWLGTGNSLVRRETFKAAGGFSNFFLYRSTMNEDVDLGLRVAREGLILFCPQARLGHFHDPGGRVSPARVAEDDVFNRFQVLHRTVGHSKLRSFALTTVFVIVESASNIAGAVRRGNWGQTGRLVHDRATGLWRIVRSHRQPKSSAGTSAFKADR